MRSDSFLLNVFGAYPRDDISLRNQASKYFLRMRMVRRSIVVKGETHTVVEICVIWSLDYVGEFHSFLSLPGIICYSPPVKEFEQIQKVFDKSGVLVTSYCSTIRWEELKRFTTEVDRLWGVNCV